MRILFDAKPDIDRLLCALRGGTPEVVPFFEIGPPPLRAYFDAVGVPYYEGDDITRRRRCLIDGMARLGFDYTQFAPMGGWFWRADRPSVEQNIEGLYGEPQRTRGYYTAEMNVIGGWADYEAYPWPDPGAPDYADAAKIKAMLPGKMGIVGHVFGPFEAVLCLLGHEKIAYVLYDTPDLFEAVCARIGETITAATERMLERPEIDLCWMGEDMGFRSATMVSPEVLRQYIFPWHKRIVDVVHAAGKLIILHSCGNLSEIYDDIVASGFDAKHSFEDAIEPVWDVQRRLGDRMRVVGGFDVDRLSRATPAEVAQHTRLLLERCGPAGYAMGSGNSIADYIPVENYLTMLNATRGYA